MGVNAEVVAGDRRGHCADDFLDLLRQRAAIGVAEHHPAGARRVRCLGTGERIGGIRLVAVEEVLAIEEHLLPRRARRGDRLADAVEVLLLGGAERDADVIVPGLGDETDGVGAGVEERAQAGIVGER